jgi:hypothetical protein
MQVIENTVVIDPAAARLSQHDDDGITRVFGQIIKAISIAIQGRRKVFRPTFKHPPPTSIAMVAIDIEWRIK